MKINQTETIFFLLVLFVDCFLFIEPVSCNNRSVEIVNKVSVIAAPPVFRTGESTEGKSIVSGEYYGKINCKEIRMDFIQKNGRVELTIYAGPVQGKWHRLFVNSVYFSDSDFVHTKKSFDTGWKFDEMKRPVLNIVCSLKHFPRSDDDFISRYPFSSIELDDEYLREPAGAVKNVIIRIVDYTKY